jgi:predicted DNA-binding transcriptional regulator AlpA
MESPILRHDRFISSDQVAHRLHVSKRTLYRRVRLGIIPAPAERRGPGSRSLWRESDIDAFIAGRGTPEECPDILPLPSVRA